MSSYDRKAADENHLVRHLYQHQASQAECPPGDPQGSVGSAQAGGASWPQTRTQRAPRWTPKALFCPCAAEQVPSWGHG